MCTQRRIEQKKQIRVLTIKNLKIVGMHLFIKLNKLYQLDYMLLLFLISLKLITPQNIKCVITDAESCSLPVEWDGEWHDSSDTEQDITFTRSSNYVEGWKHIIYADTITSWTCVDQDSSNNLVLFKLISILFQTILSTFLNNYT